MSDKGIALGSVGISESSHALLVSLVYDAEYPMEDRPFESIVEAFRFAFALGFRNGSRSKRGKNTSGVAPRQFNVMDYYELIKNEAEETSESLGLIISEYAEAGVLLINEFVQAGTPILDTLV